MREYALTHFQPMFHVLYPVKTWEYRSGKLIENGLITLNMIEYALIYYLNKQSSKYARILNVRNADNAWVQVRNQKFFQGRGEGLVELGHFDKNFFKNTRKKRPQRETFWSFSS